MSTVEGMNYWFIKYINKYCVDTDVGLKNVQLADATLK